MSRHPFNICARRTREIAALVIPRYGGLPDTDDRDIYVIVIAYHLKPRNGDLHFAIANWARRCVSHQSVVVSALLHVSGCCHEGVGALATGLASSKTTLDQFLAGSHST